MESKVMFCHFLRNFRLKPKTYFGLFKLNIVLKRIILIFRVEPTEELPAKIELDPQSFMKPKGLDKIAIVRRS